MNEIKLVFLIILIVAGACNPKIKSSQPSSRANLTSALDSLGLAIIDEGKILGFSVAIDSAGTSLYQGPFGYFDAQKTKPVQVDTRFEIASVSKLIGAAVIMKLTEEGKLTLDQSLAHLLSDFPNKEWAHSIRLRHLISHTSGLPDYGMEIDSIFFETGVVPTKRDILAFFEGKDLFFEPGTHYQYCNSGFILMAFIAENVTGQSWQQLIDQHINEPTGLDFQLIKYAHTFPDASPIFDREIDQFKKVPAWVYVMGDGGLTATPRMLSRFPQFWKNGDLIHPESYQKMIQPKRLKDQSITGYGFGVRRGELFEEPFIGHTGGWKTIYSVMAHFPNRNLTFAGMMNTDDTTSSMTGIFAGFMSIVLEKSVRDYKHNQVPLEEPSMYAGQYHGYGQEFDETGSTATIVLAENGQLTYCLEDQCDPLFYMGDHKFWLERYPNDFIEFHMDETGKATALKEYYHGFFQVFRKKQLNLP